MNSQGKSLSLRIFPDEILRQVCEPVERFDAELRELIHEMLILMRANNGIGLAAPQVGITKRLFVAEYENHTISLINPEIINFNGQDEMVEGCLSLPNVQVNIKRNERILVDGIDLTGQKIQLEMTGLWARMAQHEIDHLNGVLICDHGENLQTDEALEDGA